MNMLKSDHARTTPPSSRRNRPSMSSLAPGLVDSQIICYEFDLEAHERSVRVKLQKKVYEDVAKNISFDPSLFFIPIPEPILVIKNQRHPLVYSRAPNAVPFGVEFTEQLLAELRYFNLETVWMTAYGKPLPGETLNSFLDLNLFYVGYSIQEPMGCFESSGLHYVGGLKDRADPFKCRYIGPWGSPPKPKPKWTSKTRTQPDQPPGTAQELKEIFKEKKQNAIKDIQEHYPSLAPNTLELRIYRAYYYWTRSVDIINRPHFPWAESHAGWYCSAGIKKIAKRARCSEKSVCRYLKKWCEDHIIECRYPGEKGKSMSNYELPKSWQHVLLIRRHKKMWGLIKRKAMPVRK